MNIGMNYANVWQGDIRIKGMTTDGAFQEQCFLWEREVPVSEQAEGYKKNP